MKQATSIYLGGDLLDAIAADYPNTIDLGLHCPFCSEAVFLNKGTFSNKGTAKIQPHFKHYALNKTQGNLCEARCLTRQGKEYLKDFSAAARGQRLRLFEAKFWEIYSYDKRINQRELDYLLSIESGKRAIAKIKKHIAPDLMIQNLKAFQDFGLEPRNIQKALEAYNLGAEKNAQTMADLFSEVTANPLNSRISAEVFTWLPTCDRAYSKVIVNVVNDLREMGVPLNDLDGWKVVNSLGVAIALTDWDRNIKAVSKSGGIGFGKR